MPKKRAPLSYIYLIATGFCMGCADIVPGVSGGTMAFILGIYEKLVESIRNIARAPFWGALRRLKFRDAWRAINGSFLLAVGAGILLAVLLLARVLEKLLQTHPTYVWGFFFGLVFASVFVVCKRLKGWTIELLVASACGMLVAYTIVGLIPLQTPEAPWFLIISGAIAITAMILPGISGSFMLVILGKYEFILHAVNTRDIIPLSFFFLGAGIGIVAFAQVLSWLLRRFHDLTIAVLTGLMIGSLRRVWPWKASLSDSDILDQNVFPQSFNKETITILLLILLGAIIVFALEQLTKSLKLER
jgi:putative membrane protein